MPSRWEKRSLEEQQRIKARVENDKPEVRAKKRKEVADNLVSEIYKAGHVPIICTCGGKIAYDMAWSHPKADESYTVFIKNDQMLKKEVTMISANCMRCGRHMQRMLPAPMSDEFIFFSVVLGTLINEGKIIDKRVEC